MATHVLRHAEWNEWRMQQIFAYLDRNHIGKEIKRLDSKLRQFDDTIRNTTDAY